MYYRNASSRKQQQQQQQIAHGANQEVPDKQRERILFMTLYLTVGNKVRGFGAF